MATGANPRPANHIIESMAVISNPTGNGVIDCAHTHTRAHTY